MPNERRHATDGSPDNLRAPSAATPDDARRHPVFPIAVEAASAAEASPAMALRHEPGRGYRFHTMIKPSGSQCNLECTYCFYLHKEDLLAQPKAPRLNDSLLEAHVRQYIEAQTSDTLVFSWQGGEPTVMGLAFFERVVALQQKYRRAGQRIENDLQTNGILLDEAWAAFLKRHDFLVGLSIDGPQALHDLYRVNKAGAPTFAQVMRAASLLHEHGVPFSALCVVNRRNARRPIDVYRFLRDEVRPRMIQFIPGLEPSDFRQVAPGHWIPDTLPVVGTTASKPGHPDSVVADWSVDPDDWGYFLCRVWDEWFKRDFGRVFVDQFENVISQLFGHGPQKCVSAETCGKALALEHDGSLYSCDHFVYPEYRLGNIRDQHEGDMAFSAQQIRFGQAKRDTLPAYCRSCEALTLCRGECPKNRFVKTPSGEPGLNYLCPGLKRFYASARAARPALARRMGLS